jgi:hypothetical protein
MQCHTDEEHRSWLFVLRCCSELMDILADLQMKILTWPGAFVGSTISMRSQGNTMIVRLSQINNLVTMLQSGMASERWSGEDSRVSRCD